MKNTIYLDYNATTPVDSSVLEAMLPYFSERFGNAASNTHAYGWQASEAVKQARTQVAAFIGAIPQEVVFTSGATESINLAIKGVAEAYRAKGKHIVISATEHKAVLDTCDYLEKHGWEITRLRVNREGMIDLQELSDSVREDTILVGVMLANNETGVIHPINNIAAIAHSANAILFTDATQACGKIMVNVDDLGADLVCLSAHKLYGPKGAGALYVRRKNPRVSLVAQIHGGGHEGNLRSGTLNVPGIVGLGKACEVASSLYWEESSRLSKLRTRLEQQLSDIGAKINGNMKDRLPNTTNLFFPGIRASKIISRLTNISVATGSACSSALPEPSHVLLAMGLSEEDAYSSIRFSLGRFTTEEEIDKVVEAMTQFVREESLH